MPYDEEIAHRIRAALGAQPGITEQRMFGGLGFLTGGHLAVAAGSDGGLMVRVDPAEGDRLAAEGVAAPMVMRGRSMSGWLTVPADAVRGDREITEWVHRGLAYARTLPPKR